MTLFWKISLMVQPLGVRDKSLYRFFAGLNSSMDEIEKQFQEFAANVQNLCCNISIRQDSNGPFVLAFGLKDTHSIELRKVGNQFVLELWVGKTAEEEEIISESRFIDMHEAFESARNWLSKDQVINATL